MSPTAPARDARRRELIELLASWGATADPRVAALFDALDRRSGAGIAARVDALLERADTLPDDDTRATLEWIREACAAGRAGEREVRARFHETVEKVRSGLDRALDARRSALRSAMEPWLGSLGPRRAEPVLDALWSTAGQGEMEDRFAALDAIDEAEERFAKARKELDVELARVTKTEANAAVLDRAAQALDSGDAEEFARARRALQKELDRAELESRRRELDAALEEAAAARDRLEQAGGGAGGAASPAESAAVDALLAATAELPHPGADAPETALEAALRTARAARAECDDLAAALAAERPDRAALRAGLAEALRARAGDTAVSAPDAAGGGFYGGLRAALDALDGERAEAERAFASRAETLTAKADELERALGEAAADAAGETLAAGRLRLQDARAALAAHDPERVDAAVAAADEALDAIDASAQESRRRRKDRHAARREAARARLQRLRDAAPQNASRALAAVEAELEEHPRDAMRRLDRLEARIGGGLRREALLLAARAESAGDEAAATRLRQGILDDDLPGLSREVEEARGAPFQKRHRTRMLMLAGAAAVVFLLLALAVVWIRTAGPSATTYTLSFDEPSSGEVVAGTVTLYRDGARFADAPFVPGSPVELRLPEGRYEIYVNDRYTGRAIRVPGDAARVDAIPVPPDAPVP